MPLFDFDCRACGHRFETLVRKDSTPECPSCHGHDLERLVSLFAVSSSERRQAAATASLKKQREVAGRDAAAINAESEKHRLEDH